MINLIYYKAFVVYVSDYKASLEVYSYQSFKTAIMILIFHGNTWYTQNMHDQ